MCSDSGIRSPDVNVDIPRQLGGELPGCPGDNIDIPQQRSGEAPGCLSTDVDIPRQPGGEIPWCPDDDVDTERQPGDEIPRCPDDVDIARQPGGEIVWCPDDDVDIARQGGEDSARQREADEVDAADAVVPEGGWGWVVCMTAMLTNGTVTGFLNTLSIVYVAMLEEFGGDDPRISFKTSFVGTTVVFMTYFMSSVAGVLSDRIGIRQVALVGGFLAFVGTLSSAFVSNPMLLYLSFGALVGTGFAFTLSQSLVILCHYFHRRLGLVYSLMSFGGGAFTVMLSLAFPSLFDRIGLRNSLLVLSGLHSLLLLYAATWAPRLHPTPPNPKKSDEEEEGGAAGPTRPPGVSGGEKPSLDTRGDGTRRRTGGQRGAGHRTDAGWCRLLNTRLWRNRRYVEWVLGSSVALFGFTVGSFHMVKLAKDKFPDSNAELLPLSYGVAMTTARLLFSSVADRACVKRSYVQIHEAVLVVLGVTTFCLALADRFSVLLVAAVVMGMCDGLFFLLVGPIAVRLVLAADTSQAVGFFFGLVALPISLGPSIAGYMYDLSGSYTAAFRLLGSMSVAGGLFVFFSPLLFPSKQAVTSLTVRLNARHDVADIN